MMSETPLASTSQEGHDVSGEGEASPSSNAPASALPTPESSPGTISDDDYDAIAAAVMETERGRWFLKEYARRNRHTDTQVVLDALNRLEDRIDAAPANAGDDASVALLSHNVIDLAEAITQVKREVQELRAQGDTPDNFTTATSELEAIVTQTETATGEILEAAEKVQEVVWTLREEGASETQCDIIESKIIDIYTACSFQDLTGQRSNKVVRLVSYVEKRVASMMEILGLSDAAPQPDASTGEGSEKPNTASYQEGDLRSDAHLLHGPGMDGDAIEQDDVDALFNTDAQPQVAMDILAALPTDEPAQELVDSATPDNAEPSTDEHNAKGKSVEEVDIFTDDEIVEIHDAEVLRVPAEEALLRDALASSPPPDILDVELLDFQGPDMAETTISDTSAPTDGEDDPTSKTGDIVLNAMSDFAVDDDGAEMFVDNPQNTVTPASAAVQAPVFADDDADLDADAPVDAFSKVPAAASLEQDIFEVEDFDTVISDPEPTFVDAPQQSEEQLDASIEQVAAQADEPEDTKVDKPGSMPLADYTEEERVALFS